VLTLGIDPGTASFGFGLVAGKRHPDHVAHGCLTTPARQPIGNRLALIRDGLLPLFDRYAITAVAVEHLGYARRITSAVEVSHAIALTHLLAADHGVPIEEYAPSEIKLAVTGHGASNKATVQNMVQRLLELPDVPHPNHAADALAVAICHINSHAIRSLQRQVANQ